MNGFAVLKGRPRWLLSALQITLQNLDRPIWIIDCASDISAVVHGTLKLQTMRYKISTADLLCPVSLLLFPVHGIASSGKNNETGNKTYVVDASAEEYDICRFHSSTRRFGRFFCDWCIVRHQCKYLY